MEALEQQKLEEKTPKKSQPHVPRTARPKNKQANDIQITAEQILREAAEQQDEAFKPPEQKITDQEELEEYKLRKRKGFEDAVTKNRYLLGNYVKYARWEESQKEFRRARSVFERALDIDYRNPSMWLKYAEMEMRNKFINRARNVWDRAVTLLPRVDQLWLKYAHFEQMLGNIAGARQVFERWMEWRPGHNAWTAYAKMETRFGEVERARDIIERYVMVHPTVKAWLYYTKFEEGVEGPDKTARTRQVFERALENLGDEALNEELFLKFARFEERCKEISRARAIYKHALDHLSKDTAKGLYPKFIAFEKQYGSREHIENVIIGKRRFQYEEEIREDPENYDVWFDYIRLEENDGDMERIRDVYERAIANIPPIQEKRYWRRYIYLWINYAVFEELEAKDIERARQVYKAVLDTVPHNQFSFSKLWIMYAFFEIRQHNLQVARSIFGHAIGVAPKDKIFKAYIQMELTLGNLDRCRKLYEKYLEFNSSSCQVWMRFAELEKTAQEYERARGIFKLGVSQETLDTPELLWKAFIDFEIEMEEYDNARKLYEELLERSPHTGVWISYAMFESSIEETERARKIFERGNSEIRATGEKQDRVKLLEAWREFERQVAGEESESYKKVYGMMPTRVTRKRPIVSEDGTPLRYEEYIDYVFPEETRKRPSHKILEMAHKWKKQKAATESNK